MVTRQDRVNPIEKRCEDLKLLQCLINPSLRHEKHRSFLFIRLDLLKRTDPVESVRNTDYILFSRSNLLKRKDLCFSCLSLGLIRHRRILRSSHLSSQVIDTSQMTNKFLENTWWFILEKDWTRRDSSSVTLLRTERLWETNVTRLTNHRKQSSERGLSEFLYWF